MNGKIKRIDLADYLPDIEKLISEGLSVPLTVTGSSMSPFLVHMRDTIYVSAPVKPFKRGDIVFYRRESGQFVMHRIHHIDRSGNVYMTGDAQREIEGPLSQDCIFGEIFTVIRDGKTIGKTDRTWKFFEKIWIRVVPARKLLRRIYSLGKRIRRK